MKPSGYDFRWCVFVISTCLIAVIGCAGFGAWRSARIASVDGKALVRVELLEPSNAGTVRMRCQIELRGWNVQFKIGRRVGAKVYVFSHDSIADPSFFEPLFDNGLGRASTEEGSFELGNCPTDELLKTPQTVELKRGDSVVLAKCVRADGEAVEFFMTCE